jgi:hypothetical protein
MLGKRTVAFFFQNKMEKYNNFRQFFPQLPYELWQRVLWFVLRFTLQEKLEQCLPMKINFDVYENFYEFENENWDGHSHTTLCDNAVDDENILGFSHKFYTDCCMWYEGYAREEIVSPRDHEILYHERANSIFYKTHTFTLEKRRVDLDGVHTYKIVYLSQIYLDGSVQLVDVGYEE